MEGSNNGWVKLWRKTQDSDMYQNLNSKQRDVMMNILMLANYSKGKVEYQGEIREIKPGQCLTSLHSLKKVTGPDVSVQNIRTALNKLEQWDFLTKESTKSGTIITVVNWEKYQANREKVTEQVTKDQQRSNKEVTSNNKDKKDKEGKEDTIYTEKRLEKIKEVHQHWLNKCKDLNEARLTKKQKERINTKIEK